MNKLSFPLSGAGVWRLPLKIETLVIYFWRPFTVVELVILWTIKILLRNDFYCASWLHCRKRNKSRLSQNCVNPAREEIIFSKIRIIDGHGVTENLRWRFFSLAFKIRPRINREESGPKVTVAHLNICGKYFLAVEILKINGYCKTIAVFSSLVFRPLRWWCRLINFNNQLTSGALFLITHSLIYFLRRGWKIIPISALALLIHRV